MSSVYPLERPQPAPGPLAGIGVVITRPPRQAATLAERLAALGAQPILCPAMVIAPPAHEGPLLAILDRLREFDYALFVSANAAEAVLAREPEWPDTLTAIAVGPTTADALIAGRIDNVLVPAERYDSEGVLALAQLQDVAAKRVVLFRGEGADGGTGRATMRETLTARGATVEPVTAYRRARPTFGAEPVLRAWQAGHVDAVVATSAEVLDNFLAMIGEPGRALLAATPLFVPHPRIATHAAARGLTNIVTTSATDAGLIAGLLQHFTNPTSTEPT